MPSPSSRLLSLLSLLQTRRDWPGPVLAERLAVSPRTVRRDVDHLRELGYRIAPIKGPAGGYRLEAGSELPPLLFDDDQAVALAVALQLAATISSGIGEAALQALGTVRQAMPGRLRRRIDALQVTAITQPSPGTDAPVDPKALAAISDAIRAREVLHFDYSGARRQAEPHHLVAAGSRWYLVAWDLDREDWRTFRVDRITPRALPGNRFEPRALPGGDVHAFVLGRFRGAADGSDAWPCTGEVIVDLPAADVAPYTRDGTVEAVGPGRCRVALGAWSWAGLAAAFGRYDADLEIVGPPELADAFAALARRSAQASERFGLS